ncbi:hypothetical protein [Pleionea litopenaei]|uniref:Lipoprotein n=1 Tax=Pleionea litopenaei TaxID=3070815 RepID=A0AA51RW96_9GAMM|nr:hypothetical protein [Pleionea sp. HL-JVS1]WMS88818.1 hypothetical protein Q9312_07840 [Pleionea sp. HL-JVS1]
MKALKLGVVLLGFFAATNLIACDNLFFVSVFEVNNETHHIFLIKENGDIDEAVKLDGDDFQEMGEFSIDDGQLIYQESQIVEADEVLFQGKSNVLKIAIVRNEKNSLSSMKKFLSAMAGHPVQKSEIIAVILNGEKITFKEELAARDSSYRWKVKAKLMKDCKDIVTKKDL